jgi:biopolymer transport protein ExbD
VTPMKISRNTQRKARIEIIPMIDTMFFLLVFFMLASLSMIQQYAVPVNLPKATGVRNRPSRVDVLTITKDGKLYFDKEKIASPSEAVLRLVKQNQTGMKLLVIINADRNVEHGRVVELLDAIQQSGVAKIAIAINRSEG